MTTKSTSFSNNHFFLLHMFNSSASILVIAAIIRALYWRTQLSETRISREKFLIIQDKWAVVI